MSAAAGAGSRLAAGSTALQADWVRGRARPSTLVDLTSLEGLRGIDQFEGGTRIGALTTLADIARGVPSLAPIIGEIAGPAVRNQGTIGGNIAWRAGCLVPALLVRDARLEIETPASVEETDLSAWLGRAEPSLIRAILLPTLPDRHRWTFRKIGLRAAFSPSVINVAGLIGFDGERIRMARLAAGGGVVAPQRLDESEAGLVGRTLAETDWQDVHRRIEAELEAPGDRVRSGRYRRRVAANALVHGLSGKLPSGPARIERRNPKPASPPDEIRLSREQLADRWFVRPDLQPKISGELAYMTDHREPGMLVARILRAGLPHARILSIDIAAAEALPGVAAVVTHRDIEGRNAFGIVVQDQPALCHDKVRYAGDAIAAVAALDAATAEHALALIEVEFELLPVVSDPLAALEAGAPPVHGRGNLQRELALDRGDVEAAFRTADHVVEDVYVTPRQMHGFMETEGGYAVPTAEGGIEVFVGGQHGRRDRLQLSRILAVPEEKIRVVTSPTGGAFGGKDELTVQPALALLAMKSGRKVRMHLSRADSVLAGIKRNPMRIRMKTAVDRSGRLLAQEVDLVADGGAYASLSPSVLETALEHACGPYVVPNIKTRGRLGSTNNGTCGAFRGFGANEMSFAVECQMDRLAAACGLDPIEIRRRNLRAPGSPGYFGQAVAPTERLSEMLDAAANSALWREPSGCAPDGSEVYGVGMAFNYQGNGLGTLPPDFGGGSLRLAGDGAIEALYGLDDIGQGLIPAVQSAVASSLGCGRSDVRVIFGDTDAAPDSGSTTASRGTHVVWQAANLAAPGFSGQLLACAGRVLRREPELLEIVEGGVADKGSNSLEPIIHFADLAVALEADELPAETVSFPFPKSDYVAGNARYILISGATLARIAVSRITGQVRVLDLHMHTAAGPMLDVASYLGQIEGAMVQGLGLTLLEDTLIAEGQTLTRNLDSYMLPSIQDAPARTAVFALEDLDPGDTLGPRGIGELGIGAVAPAIANAIADAIGAWPAITPIAPEAVLDMMDRRS